MAQRSPEHRGRREQVGTSNDIGDAFGGRRMKRPHRGYRKGESGIPQHPQDELEHEYDREPMQRDVDPVITRGTIAAAENGVIKKVGESSDGTIDSSYHLGITVVLRENETQVAECGNGQARVFQDEKPVVEREAGVEGVCVGQQSQRKECE